MNVIIGERNSGKTLQLIFLSSCNNQTIVCATKQRCEAISRLALIVGWKIKEPITFRKFIDVAQIEQTETVLIDDIDYCLKTLHGGREVVSAITLENGTENNFINIGKKRII